MENNTSLETTDKTNIVTYGENAVGVLACSSPGESRTCVDAVDDEVCDSNSYEVISRADLKMNGGSITTMVLIAMVLMLMGIKHILI